LRTGAAYSSIQPENHEAGFDITLRRSLHCSTACADFPYDGRSRNFSTSDTLAPICGILLGPYISGESIVIGTFLVIAFGKSVTFLGLDFLPATVAAISLGFLVQRRFRPVIALFILPLGLFLANPPTLIFVTLPNGVSVPFNWLHLVALAVLVSPLSRRAVDWVYCAFIETASAWIYGSLFYRYNDTACDRWLPLRVGARIGVRHNHS
jgi:hypothetical protein